MTKTVHKPAPAPPSDAARAKPRLIEKCSLQHHQDEVWDVCFSHNGSLLASSGADGSTIIYEVDNFKIVHFLTGHSAGIGSAAWSPDDSKIVTCSQDSTARVWDTATGHCLHTLSGFDGPVTSCAWLSSSDMFITSSLDKNMDLCLWSSLGSLLLNFAVKPPIAPILGCVLLPDNKVASFDNQKNVYVHELEGGFRIRKIISEVDISSMCVSRLGKPYALFLRNDGLIEMIDTRTVSMVKVFKMKSYGQFVIRATFGGEGEEFVASGSEDGDIYVWGTETGEFLVKQRVHTPTSCNSVAWNPKRHGMIATAGDDHTIRILTINENEENWEHVQSEDAVAV